MARDEAFNFYYRDNLELMELAGAKVVPFSPVHDAALPDVDGIYIGGGYPELYARELSENQEMMQVAAEGARKGSAHLRRMRRADVSRERDRVGWRETGDGRPGPRKDPGEGRSAVVSYVHGSLAHDCSGAQGHADYGP